MLWWIQKAIEQARSQGHQWVIFIYRRGVWDSTDDISGRDDIEVFSVEMLADEIYEDMYDYFESMRTE